MTRIHILALYPVDGMNPGGEAHSIVPLSEIRSSDGVFDGKGRTMPDDNTDDCANNDCTDPNTGLFLAFEGEVIAPCPACGRENSLHITAPTNRFRFRCRCGAEYVTGHTLIPLDDVGDELN